MPALDAVKEPVAEVAAPVVEAPKPKTRRPRKAKLETPPVVMSEEGATSESADSSESE